MVATETDDNALARVCVCDASGKVLMDRRPLVASNLGSPGSLQADSWGKFLWANACKRHLPASKSSISGVFRAPVGW